jgi:predicted RNA-binding protein YlxR (DUF448 family)
VSPIRTCIACRERAEQGSLIRLVRVGDRIVDATEPRLAGRGAYLHRDCFDLALARHAFRRTFGPGAVVEGLFSGGESHEVEASPAAR